MWTTQDLVLLPNATTGLNVVIKSCNLGPGDALYMLDIGYGSVKKMAQAAAEASGHGVDQGPEVVIGKVQFPIRWAVVRHISSVRNVAQKQALCSVAAAPQGL